MQSTAAQLRTLSRSQVADKQVWNTHSCLLMCDHMPSETQDSATYQGSSRDSPASGFWSGCSFTFTCR